MPVSIEKFALITFREGRFDIFLFNNQPTVPPEVANKFFVTLITVNVPQAAFDFFQPVPISMDEV